jgi:hypothetical protein
MKKIFYCGIAALVMALAAKESKSSAPAFPRLTGYFENRVSLAEKSMRVASPAGTPQLQAVNVDFIAQAGFGLSEVFKLTLYPELDLVFVPRKSGTPAPAENAAP